MERDQIDRLVDELMALRMHQLTQLVRAAGGLRTLCQMGHRDRALESCEGNEIKLHVLLQLIEQLEGRIRAGVALDQALQQMMQEGWLSRIERLEMVE